MLTMHGGLYLQLRTEGALQARAILAARLAGIVLIVAFAAAGCLGRHGPRRLPDHRDAAAGFRVRSRSRRPSRGCAGGWLANYATQPWTLARADRRLRRRAARRAGRLARKRAGVAFLLSCIGVAGVVLHGRFRDVPVHHAVVEPPARAASRSGTRCRVTCTLQVMFWAVVIFVPLIVAYTSWVYRVMRGKVTAAYIRENEKSAY